MINLTFKQLRYFEALARHRHFGRAADACAISQPALSQQIKELEESLGAALFERGARQVSITNFGEEFALRVHDILRSVDELEGLARASRDRLLGRLRIGVIPTVAPYLLPTIIANLTRMDADLDINVRETLTPKLIQELAEGRLDTAIVALPVSEPSFTEVALFAEDFVLVRPAEDRGKARAQCQSAARNEAAAAGRGPLLSRSGAVVLQHAFGAAARFAGRQLAVDAGANGRRRHRRDLDPGNGGRGGDALGVGVRLAVQDPQTVANHRHDLAQDESADQTAPADIGSRSLSRRSAAGATQRAVVSRS